MKTSNYFHMRNSSNIYK